MQNYALGIVVYSLRSSSFDLGAINFIVGIPVLFPRFPADCSQTVSTAASC
jgi:hypothetical protein